MKSMTLMLFLSLGSWLPAADNAIMAYLIEDFSQGAPKDGVVVLTSGPKVDAVYIWNEGELVNAGEAEGKVVIFTNTEGNLFYRVGKAAFGAAVMFIGRRGPIALEEAPHDVLVDMDHPGHLFIYGTFGALPEVDWENAKMSYFYKLINDGHILFSGEPRSVEVDSEVEVDRPNRENQK